MRRLRWRADEAASITPPGATHSRRMKSRDSLTDEPQSIPVPEHHEGIIEQRWLAHPHRV